MNPNTGKKRLNHWVEDLFPVRYGCTSEDILSSRDASSPPTVEERAQSRAQSRARRLRDIYSGAFREQTEAARKARLEHIASIIVREYPEVSDGAAERHPAAEAPCEADGDDGAVVEKPATQERCLWSDGDLAVLRRCTQKKTATIRELESALAVSEADRRELRARCERLDKDLSESEKAGLAARQQAERRALHCRQLECEAETLRKSLGSLREVVRAAQSQASQCSRDLHAARLQQQLARERKREMKAQLQKASQEYLLKEAELQGKMELRYKSALGKLEAELRQAREELQRERQAHGRDLASLELLRRHFLNLQAPTVDNSMKITHW